ncbi:hypothetical protein [Paenibacillus sp. y28]|uniref:hypothetical protein n=1 Tax=Paenibacillus sp. y28 TaxID=3129110 RepID=UPI003017E952
MTKYRYSGLATVMFALVAVVTLLLFLVLNGPLVSQGHWSVSLASALVAELAAYSYALYLIRHTRQVQRIVPSYLAIGSVLVLYVAAVVADMVLFWFIFDVAVTTYLYIQLMTAGLAAIGVVVAAMVTKYTEDQEEEIKYQTQLMKQLQFTLYSVQEDLAGLDHAELKELQNMIADLEENVRLSNPVGHPSLASMEENLLWQAGELHKCIRGFLDEAAEVKADYPRRLVRDLVSDLNKRNRQLLLLK